MGAISVAGKGEGSLSSLRFSRLDEGDTVGSFLFLLTISSHKTRSQLLSLASTSFGHTNDQRKVELQSPAAGLGGEASDAHLGC